jgi:hypothetical protein
LRKEGRLRVLENRVLRRIFGPKRDEVTRNWRKLHNDSARVHTKRRSEENQPPQQIRDIKHIQGTAIKPSLSERRSVKTEKDKDRSLQVRRE